MKVITTICIFLIVINLIALILEIVSLRKSQPVTNPFTYEQYIKEGIKYIVVQNPTGGISIINYTLDSMEIDNQKRFYK
jgi:hypothetical protein